jgi:hypothetical protein
MLVNEQYIMLEACVEMRFKAELNDDGIMVTVDMSVNAVQTFKDITEKRRESLRERNTDSTREHLLVVDVALYPGHEVLNILWCGHLGGLLIVLVILPQVLEPKVVSDGSLMTSLVRTRLLLSSRDSSVGSRTQ